VLCLPGWIRGPATALAIALIGPWTDLSMRLARVVHHAITFGGCTTARGVAAAIIVYTIRRGGRLLHQVPGMGVAKHHKQNSNSLL
jgi:hypothetical protein